MGPMLNKLRQEAETTRGLLDRVLEDKLGWRPHPKSMSLWQLALHVASIPSAFSRLAQLDAFTAANANLGTQRCAIRVTYARNSIRRQ